MTCKDCIHYEVCQFHIDEETKMTVAECSNFKDKSKYIELPCKIGSKVYIVWGPKYRAGIDEYGVNTGKFRLSDLENIGETVFLTKAEAEAKLKELNDND